MCKAWSDAQEETAILASIEAWRDVKISEDEIKRMVMAKYNLTEQEAKDYMLKKSA